MRAIFMGTPQVAADVLKTLAAEYEIVGVFCQPDKPVGRKQILTPPAVKVTAQELGLPVFQPKSVKKQATLDLIRSLEPDIIAVVAYGKILPQTLLDIPRYGAFNLHGSLLPAYRGSAPVQRSIMDGAPVGMTAMCMSFECDAGDMLASAEIEMEETDDAVTAFEKMGRDGGALFIDAVGRYISGDLIPVEQDARYVSFAPPIEKEEARFSFLESAVSIVNKVKGLAMWPNAEFSYGGKKIKVRKALYSPVTGEPGEIISLRPFTVAAEGGSVILMRVIPEGGKEMGGEDWARGRRFSVGDRID